VAPNDASGIADPEFATLNALYWLLAGLADVEPLVLTIDDAHWLDGPSLRLLEFVLPRMEELPAVAVIATRSLDHRGEAAPLGRILADPASRIIRPDPLSPAAVAELACARFGDVPDTAFIEACVDVTAGNPFYLSELLRELALRDVQPRSDAAALVRASGPRRISLTVRFRAATGPDGLALARALAVLGDGARLEQVAALARVERDAAAAAADALTRAAILAPRPGLSFAHPIVRTAVYADLAPRERADAHARAARLLHSSGAAVDRVAAHLMNTDPAGDPTVVELLRTAATAALRQGAPETAARYLRRALAEPPAVAVRPRVLVELGRSEASAAHPNAAATSARRTRWQRIPTRAPKRPRPVRSTCSPRAASTRRSRCSPPPPKSWRTRIRIGRSSSRHSSSRLRCTNLRRPPFTSRESTASRKTSPATRPAPA
jgi:predicted ATPase